MKELAIEEMEKEKQAELAAQQEDVAKQITEQQVEQANQPADVHALFFKRNINVYSNMIDQLSMRQLRRVAKGLVMYPLETTTFQHGSGVETQVLKLGEDLLQSKMVMMLQTIADLEQQANNNTEGDNKTSSQDNNVQIENVQKES